MWCAGDALQGHFHSQSLLAPDRVAPFWQPSSSNTEHPVSGSVLEGAGLPASRPRLDYRFCHCYGALRRRFLA